MAACVRPGLARVLAVAVALAALAACGGAGGGSGAPDAAADAAARDATAPLDLGSTDGAARDGAADATAAPDVSGVPVCEAAGGFGCPCFSNDDCDTGYCVPWDEGYVCSRTCVEWCPPGWDCRAVATSFPDVLFVCWPGQSRLCQACAADAPCGEGYCLTFADGRRCSRPCNARTPCPAGYVCQDDVRSEEDPARFGAQCVPVSGACDCGPWVAEEDLVRPCNRSNSFGNCWGDQRCRPDLGWTPCSAPEPADETCDGRDEDCDGYVDEGAPAPAAACERSGAAGTCRGEWICAGLEGWACTAAEPAAETCDGRDDDCDGATDEDFRDAATGAYVGDAHCGACGVDCAGAVAHGGARCVLADGRARCEVAACDPGHYPAGPFTCAPASDDRCAPCLTDADCPTPGDACVDLDGGRFCGRDCGPDNLHESAAGVCPDGFVCAEVGAGRQCLPASGSCSCLAGDEGATRPCAVHAAEGTCYGEQTCAPEAGWSACSAAVPSPETCNGRDDDCDGAVDEAAAPPAEPCQRSGAAGTCRGDWLCRGAEGWACTAPEPAAETCDGRDEDCDGGVDEDFRADGGSGPYATDEHCGACGVSCAGAVADGAAHCVVAAGRARCEVATCEPGFYPAGPLTCAPVRDARCAPCLTDADCPTPGDRCLDLDGGRFCGRDCGASNLHGTPAGECPDGFVCAPVGDDRQCRPPSGSCTCLAADAGATRPCVARSEHGACFGEQTCAPATGWGACSAPTPAAETCNGRDDDCNALADDLPGRGDACLVENAFGRCPGVRDCTGGAAGLVCVGATPAAETCNGRDDDCDGVTDEEPRWANRGQVCTAGQGVCQAWGVWRCDPGDPAAPTVCDARPTAGGAEVCDGLDNDCDGRTDEDLAAPLCEEQRGVCAGARKVCGGGLGWLACTVERYPASYEYREVTCDDLDNDCDGATDAVDVDGDGQVAEACGGDDCDDLNPVVYEGAPEVCGDGLDNDCDGTPENRDVDGDGVVAAPCGGGDCNDGSRLARPGLEEVCGDRLDNDCDGSIDNKDVDGDSFRDPACGGTDCDDRRPTVHPGAPEVCNDLDDDCNGLTDDKDIDRDGHRDDDPLCGGDDCDDGDPLVSPSRAEVCGDEVDEDCSGRLDDRDVDRDGFLDGVGPCVGTDCDDFDPLVYPGAREIYDAKDTDCDGLVDEGGLIPPGAVIVSEVMQDPSAAADSAGEWFEVYNAWTFPVNLHSWVVADADGPDRFQVGAPQGIVVPAGGTAVFCRNPNPDLNGGVACDYGFDDFILSNADDEIILSLDGVVIDRVAWDGGPAFPDPTGASMTLDPNAFTAAANDLGGNWCAAPLVDRLPGGDRGSPGRINTSCTGAPVVTGVTPRDGVDDGGETLRILGAGFTGATAVRVGGLACASWAVLDVNTIRCITPPHAAGDVDVTVVKGAQLATLANGYRYTGEAVRVLDWADLQWPRTLSAAAGYPSALVYCQCHAPGVTEPDGAPSGVRAQVGFGPHLSDPRDAPGWTWTDAVWHRQYYANDEFRQTLTVPMAGTYSFACRFSDDDGLNFLYGDFDPGTADGFRTADLGVLTVD